MSTKLCLVCKKGNRFIQSRGVCGGCYQKLRKLVLSGRTTWESLIARGWAEDRGQRGRAAEELINSEASITDEVKLDVVWICQESGCDLIATNAEEYSEHRRKTDHYLKMVKRTVELEQLKNLPPAIPDELRVMAQLTVGEEGEVEGSRDLGSEVGPNFPTGE